MSMLVSNHDQALTGDTTYTRVLELNGPSQIVGIPQQESVQRKSLVAPTIFSDGFLISFTSELLNQEKTYMLHNSQGKLIFTKNTKAANSYQEGQSLPPGIYYLSIKYPDGQETFKLIKTN